MVLLVALARGFEIGVGGLRRRPRGLARETGTRRARGDRGVVARPRPVAGGRGPARPVSLNQVQETRVRGRPRTEAPATGRRRRRLRRHRGCVLTHGTSKTTTTLFRARSPAEPRARARRSRPARATRDGAQSRAARPTPGDRPVSDRPTRASRGLKRNDPRRAKRGDPALGRVSHRSPDRAFAVRNADKWHGSSGEEEREKKERRGIRGRPDAQTLGCSSPPRGADLGASRRPRSLASSTSRSCCLIKMSQPRSILSAATRYVASPPQQKLSTPLVSRRARVGQLPVL